MFAVHNLATIGVIFSSLLFAQIPLIEKYAQFHNIAILPIVICSLFIVGLLLFPCTLRIHLRDIPKSTFYGLLAIALTRVGTGCCYLLALSLLPASNAVLLFYLAPFFLQLQTVLFGFEPFRLIYLYVSMFAFLGILILLGYSKEVHGVGVIYGVLAAIFLSWQYMLIQKYIPPKKVIPYYALSSFMLSIILMIVLPFFYLFYQPYFLQVSGMFLSISLVLAIITILAVLVLIKSIQIIGINKASLYAFSEPIFVILIAIIIGWETFTLYTFIGAFMVISALILLHLLSTTPFNSTTKHQ